MIFPNVLKMKKILIGIEEIVRKFLEKFVEKLK